MCSCERSGVGAANWIHSLFKCKYMLLTIKLYIQPLNCVIVCSCVLGCTREDERTTCVSPGELNLVLPLVAMLMLWAFLLAQGFLTYKGSMFVYICGVDNKRKSNFHWQNGEVRYVHLYSEMLSEKLANEAVIIQESVFCYLLVETMTQGVVTEKENFISNKPALLEGVGIYLQRPSCFLFWKYFICFFPQKMISWYQTGGFLNWVFIWKMYASRIWATYFWSSHRSAQIPSLKVKM